MKTKATANVRQRILETAARLFYQQGYPLTGINQLIAEADVAKASLYQHFRTKDEILLAYLQQASQQWFQQVAEATASGTTPKAKVLAVFDMLHDFLVTENFRGCNFQNALLQLPPEETQVRAFIQEHKVRIGRVFNEILNDTALAEEMALLFEGALVSSQTIGNPAPVATARRVTERLL
ncbi:TetR/AcrR family transcriptional regulator [Hymenobacter volaticus]|uniref:TetR/AcrR family transcriptional regulator n=1 Tax=Hymenobacter volaticus TaxID=2932254 RepID=A0ABY4GD62_9BACT|nr:TetR/AcrR family transcriptional regulator [Hymenobacter volaticus]UOQ68778.1 TetR/AcrR family transcriptional regulator [Hymenobacter volaticus]